MASSSPKYCCDEMDIDSDFYGDEQLASDLTRRVEQLDAQKWWEDRKSTPPTPQPSQGPPDSSNLHNPYEGCPNAWQLTETLESFFSRLPPATTQASESVPWIYICNPHARRKHKSEAQNQRSRGNENEGTEEEGSNLPHASEGGMARLHLLGDFIQGARAFGASPAVARDIAEQRSQAADDILNLAWNCKVRVGKWMIFCEPSKVNAVWETVARATANGELGIAAKVAPRPEEAFQARTRLICVYTRDFRDRRDVWRVLERLRELRLVEKGKPLYYKPDIFTYIGLDSGNPWGVKVSIYKSFP